MILADMVDLNVSVSLGRIGTNRSALDSVGLENNAEGDEERRNNGIRKMDGWICRRSERSGKILRIGICRIVKSTGLSEFKKLN